MLKVVVLDGLIGCGKTTAVEILTDAFHSIGWRVFVVNEPVDNWKKSGRLAQFYEDIPRRSYQFQTRAFRDRVREMQVVWQDIRESVDSDQPTIVLMERSIFSGKLFVDILVEQGLMDPTEAEDYFQLMNMWPSLLPAIPDLFLYLRPSLQTVMARLKDRARSEDVGVPLTYQKCLMDHHDAYYATGSQLLDGKRCPMKILETNFNYRDDPEGAARLLEMVLSEVVADYKSDF